MNQLQLSSLIPILLLLGGTLSAPTRTFAKRALPKLGGINLAGCDFGINTSGWSGISFCPGTEQIGHFVSKGANLIRIPIGWQYLVLGQRNSTTFDEAFFSKYDTLVKASLTAGAYVMIDLHNYARWDSEIIGQGGPSNEDFANFWTNIATRYATEEKVIFGLMNEPHDLDIVLWASTVQAAVNAIRAAGATSQSIALPGTLYTHPEKWYDGTNDPLIAVTDPAGSDKSKLIIDVHQYLDSDGSGTSTECTTNAIDKLTKLSTWLNANGRRAIVSEIGGGNTESCQKNLAETLKYISTNDAYIGFAVWSAGSFDSSYELSISPQDGVDNDLFIKAIQPYFPESAGKTVPISSSASGSVSASTSDSSASSSPASASTSPTSASQTSESPSSAAVSGAISTDSASVIPSSQSNTVISSATSSTETSSVALSSSIKSDTVTITSTPEPASSSLSQSASSSPDPISSSSSIAPAPPAPTSPVKSIPAPSPSASAPPAPAPPVQTAPPAPPVPAGAGNSGIGNLQTFTGTLGGPAPAVTKTISGYVSGTTTYHFLIDALNGSCYAQMDACQLAANAAGNKAPLTVEVCNGEQVEVCLAEAAKTQ